METNLLFDHILEYSEKYHLIPDRSTILVGLSGGPDSVFLLNFLVQLRQKNLTIIAAHLDHEWRENSAEDAVFCKNLSEKCGVHFISQKASQLSLKVKKTGSLEETGRMMRRHFLESALRETGADRIALAHHADDQEETFFIRLIRGTSLSGLVGMQPQSGPYVRPLLSTFKKDIIAYLDSKQMCYLVDPSNEKPDFLRNRIRQTVLPVLRATDSRFDKNFMTTLQQLQAAENTVKQLTENLFFELAHKKDEVWFIDAPKLLSLDPYLRNRIILHWLIEERVTFTPSENFFAEIMRFVEQPGSKDHRMHAFWGIRKKKNVLSIYKSAAEASSDI